MKCPACGAEFDGAVCPTCGWAAEPARAASSSDHTPAETQAPKAPKSPKPPKKPADPAALADAITANIKGFFTRKVLVIAGAVLAGLLVLGCVFNALLGGTGFTAEKELLMPFPDTDKKVHVLAGHKELKGSAELDQSLLCEDGRSALSLDKDKNLLLITSSGFKKLAVSGVDKLRAVSRDGSGAVYQDDEQVYYYLNVSSKKSVKISENSIQNITFSPDGKSFLYTATEELETKLYFFNGKEALYIGKSVSPLSVSNGGKYIFAVGDGKIWRYSNKGGDKEKIGEYSSAYGIFVNLSGTQLLFSDGEKTYYSENGKEAVKVNGSVTSNCITPMLTHTSQARTSSARLVRVYAKNLLACLWYSGDNVYTYTKGGEKKKVASDVDRMLWTADGEYLFWNSDSSLYRKKLGTDKEELLSEEAEDFYACANGKYVYFEDDSGVLFGVKNGGKPKQIAEDAENIVMSADNVLFYMLDGDLYACSNGRKGSFVMADVDSLVLFGDTVVVLSDDDQIYVDKGAKVKQVFKDVDFKLGVGEQ